MGGDGGGEPGGAGGEGAGSANRASSRLLVVDAKLDTTFSGTGEEELPLPEADNISTASNALDTDSAVISLGAAVTAANPSPTISLISCDIEVVAPPLDVTRDSKLAASRFRVVEFSINKQGFDNLLKLEILLVHRWLSHKAYGGRSYSFRCGHCEVQVLKPNAVVRALL